MNKIKVADWKSLSNINTKAKSDYINILQIFRGIAALMVVCHHTVGSIKFYHNIEYPFFNYIGIIGKYGVDFFFVLSGFIITYTTNSKYNQPNSFKNYIKNRLIRIYVPYLPIGILMLGLYTFFPHFSNSDRDISVLTSFTLLPFGNPALSVAWTLTFELCFYLLFSISFFSRKGWNYFVLVWFTLIIATNYTSLKNLYIIQNSYAKVFFSVYYIEFICGYCLALLFIANKKMNLKLIFTALAFSTAFFLYTILSRTDVFYFSNNFLFAFCTFLIMYLAIIYFPSKKKKNTIMMLIGNATYSIYLIHNPLQMIIIRLYPKINSWVSLTFALIFVLIISNLIGYLYYLLFEKVAIKKIKAFV